MIVKNIKENYTEFHAKKSSNHLYPTEWVIRTMLGQYPNLKLDKSKYSKGKILDLGFGDGRNFPLLHNCGLQIHGTEVSQGLCDSVVNTFNLLGIETKLKVGTNANLPFDDLYFDYLLASSSCYYVDDNGNFDSIVQELQRVLKSDAWLIANFPLFSIETSFIKESFILENCIHTSDGHIIIENDIYGIRNGYKFKAVSSEDEIINLFSEFFDSFGFGYCYDNYYGVQINSIFVTCRKK